MHKESKMLLIEWWDSCSHHDWMPKEVAEERGLAKCASCGFLVKETSKRISVAVNQMLPTEIHDGGFGEMIVIPKAVIISIKELVYK